MKMKAPIESPPRRQVQAGVVAKPAVAPRRCLVFSASRTRGSNGPVEGTGSEARVQVC
jgi:hypothetical protein